MSILSEASATRHAQYEVAVRTQRVQHPARLPTCCRCTKSPSCRCKKWTCPSRKQQVAGRRARALSHSNYILYSESMPVGPEVRTRRIQLCINNLFIQYNVAAQSPCSTIPSDFSRTVRGFCGFPYSSMGQPSNRGLVCTHLSERRYFRSQL